MVDENSEYRPPSHATVYDDLDRFWEARIPVSDRGCPEECGACWECGVKWAITWSLAVLSNPRLAVEAEGHPPFVRKGANP